MMLVSKSEEISLQMFFPTPPPPLATQASSGCWQKPCVQLAVPWKTHEFFVCCFLASSTQTLLVQQAAPVSLPRVRGGVVAGSLLGPHGLPGSDCKPLIPVRQWTWQVKAEAILSRQAQASGEQEAGPRGERPVSGRMRGSLGTTVSISRPGLLSGGVMRGAWLCKRMCFKRAKASD